MVRFIPIILALVAAPAIGQTASAASAAPAATPAPAAKQLAKDRMVCRTLEETGTRLGGKRVCQLASQWQEQQRLQRQEVEEQQR